MRIRCHPEHSEGSPETGADGGIFAVSAAQDDTLAAAVSLVRRVRPTPRGAATWSAMRSSSLPAAAGDHRSGIRPDAALRSGDTAFRLGHAHATVQNRYADDLDLPPKGRDRLVPRGYAGSRGPLNSGWQLSKVLRKYAGYTPGENIHPFYYDWRLSARDNAERLGELADRIRGSGKVDIVTHSAGAIVALTYVKLGRGADAVEHLILIAPTGRGVADAFRIIVRPERFLRRVLSSEIVATWPSALELLPEDGRFLVNADGTPVEFDAWNLESWRRFGRSDPSFGKLLESARRFRDELRSTPLPPQVDVTVLAGDCVPTAKRVLSRSDGTFVFYRYELRESEKSLVKTLFEAGDGTVPISSSGPRAMSSSSATAIRGSPLTPTSIGR